MTDIYIATPTQADYDALMRLAEAAGYTWGSGNNPTHPEYWDDKKEETIIQLDQECRRLFYSDITHPDFKGCKIETIPGIANIKAVYRLHENYLPGFVKHHPIPEQLSSKQNVIAVLCKDYAYYCVDEPIMDALAVDLKPKESEVMPEKVKLPKEIFEVLKEYGMPNYPDSADFYPLTELYSINRFRHNPEAGEAQRVLGEYLRGNIDNQWKLIDALRNGYEPEPEQLYYVRFIEDNENSFLKLDTADDSLYMGDRLEITKTTKTQFTMEQIRKISPKFEQFAVKVEEVDE